MAHKWIIENKEFKSGCVELHCELATNKYKATRREVDGGGILYIDDKNKILYLFGKSFDFGQFTVDKVKSCEFEFWYDDYTIKFCHETDLNKVLSFDDSQFNYIRKPINEKDKAK